jgi:hypothetical protein
MRDRAWRAVRPQGLLTIDRMDLIKLDLDLEAKYPAENGS